MLSLKKIKKVYNTNNFSQKALDNVSLDFRECEFVSILGPSGSGKTTLLNIIGGLDHYDSGDLIINGTSTKKYNDRAWDTYRNHQVGFVFQSYNLIPHQTVLANVELALTLSGVSKNERRKRAKDALISVGLKEHMHKKPNQLSGGQMQRVAIARSLVNNPSIVLADEPTGALDSKTSEQIMNLLKEVAKDRLVIMVTHNAELANKYSTRIVELKDGNIINDSNPYKEKKIAEKLNMKKLKKTSMSFKTALSLSLNNLMTKKGRTFLTAFAGSIGIIGIALILSLSNGVNKYINDVEEEILTSYPILIEENAVNTADVLATIMDAQKKENHKDKDVIYSNDLMTEMLSTMSSSKNANNITKFKEYLDNNKDIKNYTSSITNGYDIELQIYKNDLDNILQVNPNNILEDLGMNMSNPMVTSSVFVELFENQNINEKMFSLVEGSWPKKYDEVVLLIDENDEISDYTLYALGLKDPKEIKKMYNQILDGKEINVKQTKYNRKDLMNLDFKVILNTDYYKKENNFWVNKKDDNNYMKQVLSDALDIKVVGIIKYNDEAIGGSTSGAIMYRSDLTDFIIDKINESEIVKEQKNNKDINVLTGMKFNTDKEFDFNNLSNEQKMYLQSLPPTEAAALLETYNKEASASLESVLKTLGVVNKDKPSSLSIFPKDFESKEKIIDIINEYNDQEKAAGRDENVINYTDIVGLMMDGVSTIVNVIGYVLIAFVSISLIVSSIMIGIITYISVLERTKEIGILRAIGASKKDISRVFNAETFIVGLFAGLLGIGITILLNIPINIIIRHLTDIHRVTSLPIVGATILVIISILLTTIAGLIPSRIASKKDPVESLRTE